jgi:hypothetical protein
VLAYATPRWDLEGQAQMTENPPLAAAATTAAVEGQQAEEAMPVWQQRIRWHRQQSVWSNFVYQWR